MKRGKFILIFLLIFYILFFVSAQAQDQINQTGNSDIVYKSNYDNLNIEMILSNELNLEGGSANITVFVFPTEDIRQELISMKLLDDKGNEIPYSEKNGRINFQINNGIKEFSLVSQVKTFYFNPEIKEKISLEQLVSNLPEDISYYAFSSSEEYADYRDPFIKNKAEQLAYSDDSLVVIHNLAEYVRSNMNYDLSQTDLKKASEIMQDKRGVCSHYTILFMALARSLGIPVKYVTGLAYSNYEKKFREHAWAEVWLGENYGWVPYDPTLGEYGWIDSYHIKLKESFDAGTKAIEYKYTGTMDPGIINITSKILNYGEEREIPIYFTIKPTIVETGLDSYVPLEIKAENNYYFSWPVSLVSAPDYFGQTFKIMLLKPGDQNIGYFLIHTPNSRQCENGCISDIIVEDLFENSAKTQIVFKKDNAIITLEEAQKLVSQNQILGANLDIFCKSEKKYYYDYEKARIICILDNKEEYTKQIQICLADICEIDYINDNSVKQQDITYDIQKNEKNLENFTRPMTSIIKCVSAKEGEELLGISCIDFVVLKTPRIEIEPVSSTKIKYGGKIIIPLNITANTNIDLTINITNTELKYKDQNTFWLKNGKQTTGLIVDSLKMRNLQPGEYQIKVLAYYIDKNNQPYVEETNIPIEIEDTTFFNKIWVGIKKIFV